MAKRKAKSLLNSVVSAMLVVGTLAAPANAITPSGRGISIEALGRPSFIEEGARVARPFAHVLFCKAQPAECVPNGDGGPVALTEERLIQLADINAITNSRIKPVMDSVTPMGSDKWSLAPRSGDCEDFAITKRHELINRGWPASSLRLASAYTPKGLAHMVLVVRTSAGDLVLDNLTNRVLPWDATGLRWKTIQAADPNRWFALS